MYRQARGRLRVAILLRTSAVLRGTDVIVSWCRHGFRRSLFSAVKGHVHGTDDPVAPQPHSGTLEVTVAVPRGTWKAITVFGMTSAMNLLPRGLADSYAVTLEPLPNRDRRRSIYYDISIV